MESEEELGAVVEDLGKRGDKPKGVGDVIQGSDAGSAYFYVRDVGDEPLHRMVRVYPQHRVDICITGRQARWLLGGSWGYKILKTVMNEVGFEDVEAYVPRRPNAVAQCIATRPILYLCK